MNHLTATTAALLLACAPAAARPLEDAPAPAVSDAALRTAEGPRRLALQVVSRRYRRAAPGPDVTLVGVSHIGEPGLYAAIQALLERQDVVLYESIKPPGTGGAGGEDEPQRRRSTKAAMAFIASVAAAHREAEGRYPTDAAALREFAAEIDPRLAEFLDNARRDAWGNEIVYRSGPDAGGFALTSFGADGRPGGEGAAADLRLDDDEAVPLPDRRGDSLQGELAAALDLEFQLDALDYDRPHFRCSDLAADQLERALAEEGVDFAGIEGSLAATSLPGRIVVMLLRVVRLFDVFLDGAIADAGKVMLIELLGDQEVLELTMAQYGAGFEKVLIDLRNQLVVDDLKAVIEDEPDVESVAILYGAAHLDDLAERLGDQLGYRPVDEQWLTAIEVDLDETAIAPETIERIRTTVRTQLRLMAPPRKPAPEADRHVP